MQNVEDALIDSLESDLQSVLAFVYTGQNQREWHWYSSDVKETGKRINAALSEFDGLPIELSAEETADIWSFVLWQFGVEQFQPQRKLSN